MKKTYTLLLVSVSLFLLTSGTPIEDFEAVLNRIKDKNLKARLTTFMKQGIEKYHPEGYKADSILNAALHYEGARYRYGASNSKFMDCSGLFFRSGKDIGISLPHQSIELARYGKIVSQPDSLKKGDMVFFKTTKRFIGHTGIMIDSKQFVHMSRSRGWTISSIDEPYYAKGILFGTREYLEKRYSREPELPIAPIIQMPTLPVRSRSLTFTAGLPRYTE